MKTIPDEFNLLALHEAQSDKDESKRELIETFQKLITKAYLRGYKEGQENNSQCMEV